MHKKQLRLAIAKNNTQNAITARWQQGTHRLNRRRNRVQRVRQRIQRIESMLVRVVRIAKDLNQEALRTRQDIVDFFLNG
jgi:hypothetical protein